MAGGYQGGAGTASDGTPRPAVKVPMKHPMSSYFTATVRGGSPRSKTLELLGPGLRGLMLACMLAALMSSVDCYMLVSSALVVRNIYAAYINPEATEARYVLVGRITGLVWIGGFLGFLAAKRIPAGWIGRLLTIGVLIGVQGAVGWWMVHSGLQGEMTDVASYRLALHLGLAFVILGLIAWAVMLLGRREADLLQARRLRERALWGMETGLLHLSFLQILFGALVSGIDAGRGYTDWPLMAGQMFPPDAFEIAPVWRNFFENAGLVQFIHRVVGYLLALFAIGVMIRGRRAGSAATRNAAWLAGGMVLVQMVLGIVTVLNGAALWIAITHQLGAVVAWLLILRARFQAGYPEPQSVRG